MIEIRTTLAGLRPEDLAGGFFVDWPNPPDPQSHLRLLAGSSLVALAVDGTNGQVVGFATALSDGILTAYIPLLEVLPAYQGRGLGTLLLRSLMERLDDLYAVDLLCDPDLVPFYERFEMKPAQGMARRRYTHQSGRPTVGYPKGR